jgi:sulfide:quinone oxidoreductase
MPITQPKVLVAYASKHGATREIAEAIAAELRTEGCTADCHEAQDAPPPDGYDAVVLGSATYMKHWRREARHFLHHHRAALAQRPLWLFSSGPVGAQEPDPAWLEPHVVLRAAEQLGARDHVVFGGRVPADPQNFVERAMARDTPEQDADRRDWDEIRAWARSVAAELVPNPAITPLRVVIAGGGVGALEALMALHDLGEQQLSLTLIAPDDDFVLRPMSVAVPFSEGHVTRVPLAKVCARFGARRVPSAVRSVDPAARTVTCGNGDVVAYDRLVLATGAATRPAYASALTFDDGDPVELNGLLRDIEQGYVGSIALVVPPAGSWALPIYELALLLAKYTRSVGFPDTPIHVVTPESAPLAIFGPQASAAVDALLGENGIMVHAGSYATIERSGSIAMAPGDRHLKVQRVVALPIVVGRAIDGVPADDHGFVPVDEHGRVLGLDDVYAVGDGANFPVKQGGLAAQQADAAARDICADAGAPVEREPFRPVLRGMLLTGEQPRFLRHPAAGGAGESRVSTEQLWWPPTKVVGHYLAPWLAREAGVDVAGPREGVSVEAELSARPDDRPLALAPLGALPHHGRW